MPKHISDSAGVAQTTDRTPAETRIRSLAIQTALSADRILPDGECDRIVALACGQLTPEQLRTGQVGSDILARVAEMTQRALDVGPVNYLSATKAQVEARSRQDGAEGRFINGQWVSGRKAADAVAGRASYQSLALSDARGLQSITAQNFGSSPFAAAGLDFGTFSYLRAQGPFSAQNILTAANDTKALGFKTTDRAAMLDHSIIDRFDPKARQTNGSLRDYQKRIEGDEELADLHHQRRGAKTAEQRKTIDGKIAERRARHAEESGLNSRISDPKGHPTAMKATKRRKTVIEKRAEAVYGKIATPKAAAQTVTPPPSKSGAALFKQLTGPSSR